MIDDGGNFRVRIDLNELGAILIALPNVNEMFLGRQARFFEHYVDFLHVRASQCVEIDHCFDPTWFVSPPGFGNHTFTHPNFDEISRTQLKWELNLTQRLIESTLGVKSLLFRPPYGIDHQPEYAEEVAQLPYPQDLGYIIVGQRVDPDDWRIDGSRRSVRQRKLSKT